MVNHTSDLKSGRNMDNVHFISTFTLFIASLTRRGHIKLQSANRIGIWMISYGQSNAMRSLVDKFQRRHSCCGNLDVRGWYDIPTWSSDDAVRRGLAVGFPASCCNVDTEQQVNAANRTCTNVVAPDATNELSATYENGCFIAFVDLYRCVDSSQLQSSAFT
jgi:hypothetical protein